MSSKDSWTFGERYRPVVTKRKMNYVPLVAMITALFTLAFVGIAAADNLQSDLNTTTGGLQKTVDRGVLSPSSAYTQDVFLFVDTQPGATNEPTYPFNVSLGSATLGATFSGVTISSAGTANGQTGQVSWTTPAAQATAQDYSIAVTFDANTTINESPASVTIRFSIAAAPSNTQPTVVVTGVTDGSSYNKGSVPAAGCSWTDTEDGGGTFAATLSAITGPYASDGIGSQTASCSFTDTGALSATASATYSIVDPTAPSISYALSPASADGSNDWYKSNVTLTWTVTENESPNSLVETGCVDQTITSDQAETTYSCSATSAGGSADQVNVSIKRDATAPTASASASPAANGNGWNNTDVTVTFDGTDSLSGVASCTTAATLSSEGAGQSASGTCTDKAGNVSAPATASGINIDKTAPSVSLVGGPADGGSYYFGSVPAAPTCNASDAMSGLDGSCSVTGYSAAVGSHTVMAQATDKAGNSDSASATYNVLAWTLTGFYSPVDMNGVYNVVKGGSTVPLKFEIFAGPTELTATSSVKSFVQTKVACDGTLPTDEIEVTTTGGTSLRYDTVAGQFIQNWQTPKLAGQCYRVTMTTQDDSSLVAFFKLK